LKELLKVGKTKVAVASGQDIGSRIKHRDNHSNAMLHLYIYRPTRLASAMIGLIDIISAHGFALRIGEIGVN
jgi:hypothetical protein